MQIFQKPPFNYQYQVGIANLVDYEFDPISLVAPVTDGLLQNVVIPGRTFVQNGQRAQVNAYGQATAHGATLINFSVLLNVAVIMTPSTGTNGSPHGWEMQLVFMRLSPTSLLFFGLWDFNHGTGGVCVNLGHQGTFAVLTGLNLEADLTIQFRATSAGTETITQNASWVTIQ